MVDDLASLLNRKYLKLRQQYWHVQALVAHFSKRSLPSPRFILFGRGRSGTTVLVNLLNSLPHLQCEGEILHNYVPFPRLHVQGRSARSKASGYGGKILSYQIRDVQTALDAPDTFLQTLNQKDGFRILYLRRKNLLRHALSNIRARHEQFHRKQSERPQQRPALHVDPEHVVEWMDSSKALRDYEHRLLNGLPHLSLTYEEHLKDPPSHQSTVDMVCEYLGIESAPVQTEYQKIAPRSLREGVSNYDVLAEHLATTEYAKYLEET